MTDLSSSIAPKSDQLNADDLISGPRTITITRVTKRHQKAEEQPVSIHFEGDDGKPYKPCKSMLRLLVGMWGKDGAAYTGRRLTLYRDPTVLFGGVAVGGIRISHMSHIDREKTLALTATRGSRKPYTVKPLADTPSQSAARPPRPPTGGGGASLPPSPPSSDFVDFAGATYDPARPMTLAPIPIGDMSDREVQDLGRALRALIERAPTDAAPAWQTENEDDLLRIKGRSMTLYNWIIEPLSAGVSPTAKPADGGAASRDGDIQGGEAVPPHQHVGGR